MTADRDDRFTVGDPLRFRFEDDTPRQVMPVPPEWAHRKIARPEPVKPLTEYEKRQRRYGVAEGREYRTPEMQAVAKRIWERVRVEVCDGVAGGPRRHGVLHTHQLPAGGCGDLAGPAAAEIARDDDELLDADAGRWADMLAEERDSAAENALGRLTL